MPEEALLALVRVVSEKHEALAAASGQNFSLFEILGRETDEVRTHSGILAALLDPNGSHGQGAVFARRFAERFGIPTGGIESAGVWREVKVANESRVDILMQIGDTRVVVENKIHAPDQPRQLERYHAYAKQSRSYKVMYLTLHGDSPGDDALGGLEGDEVLCISYERDLVAWLDDCIKEVARVPQLREILAHYQALLRKLTGTSTGELIMDLEALLRNKQGETYNFELAPRIAEVMAALSVREEWNFWRTLKERLQEDRRLTVLSERIAPDPSLNEVDEAVVRHAHGVGNKNKWFYGWTFRMESPAIAARSGAGDREVVLRVECDDSTWGFYGFAAVEKTPDGLRRLSRDDAPRLFDDWRRRMAGVEPRWRTDGKLWLAWTYPAEDLPLHKPRGWLEPSVIRRFVEGEAVKALVADVLGTMDRLEAVAEETETD